MIMQKPLKILQITDTHLFRDSTRSLLGVNTDESLRAVLSEIQTTTDTKNFDLILLTGDLAQDGSEAAYERLAQLLEPFKLPVYCLVGNHDDLNILSKVYPCGNIKCENHIVFPKWHLILLNSQLPGQVQGYLDQSQLNFLRQCLNSHPNHYAVILFHHQPTAVGAKWLDALGIENANEFWKIIADYPKVNLVSFGHVHQEFDKKINGIQCFATPSTCIQFKRGQDHFGLENLPPGYRWLNLFPDGHIESGVHRIPEYIGVFDDKAKGY